MNSSHDRGGSAEERVSIGVASAMRVVLRASGAKSATKSVTTLAALQEHGAATADTHGRSSLARTRSRRTR